MQSEITRLEREIREFASQAERIDAEEDGLYGKGKKVHEISEELRRRQDRLERIARAKVELEQEARRARERSPVSGLSYACAATSSSWSTQSDSLHEVLQPT